MRKLMLVLAAVTWTMAAGCSGTIPITSYSPQNAVRYEHHNSVDMGAFTYEPEFTRNMRANQISNTAVGSLYISSSVAELVKRVTALELEKTGILLNDASAVAIGGDVLVLHANDLGWSVDWTYAIRYKILQKPYNKELFSKEYRPSVKKTGKFAGYNATINELVLSGYEMFIRDPAVRTFLDVPPLPEKKSVGAKKQS